MDTDHGTLPDTPDTPVDGAPGDVTVPDPAAREQQADASGEGDVDADTAVMELLSEKVPLSLIIDLSAPAGPDSEQIMDDEGEPESPWWEPAS